MTIGSLSNVRNDNDSDFHRLKQCREQLCEKYALPLTDMDLSMGMSHDYERAIQAGSTIVRLGSVLFGERT
jgi:PLP dependent protein